MKTSLILLALAFITTAAFAHPGKTDAKGWHTDSKTGKRHQHPKPAKKDEAKKPESKKPVPKKKK